MDKAEEAGRSNEASGGGHPVGGPQMPQPLWLAGPSVRWPGATASQSLTVARQVPSGGRWLPLQSSPQPGTGTPPRGPGTCSRPGQAGQPGTGPTSSWKRPADRSYLHRLVAYSGILESRRRRNPSEQYCIADGQFKLTREKLSRARF